MRIHFQLTVDDLVEANRFHSARRFQRLRPMAYGAGLLLILLLLGVQILYYSQFLNLVFAGAALWFLSYSIVMRRARRRGIQKAWDRSPSLHQPLKYEVSERGVASKGKDSRGETDWTDLREFLETPHLFLLYNSPELYFVIPKRACENASQLETFRALLQAKLGKPRP